MITVGGIFDFLCMRYPLNTACDFDNAGLLVGNRENKVKRALVCLDCDKSAVDYAISNGFDLIITHHPVIWDGLKSITADSLIYRLIRADISVISMHTNLDIADGGVTDRLCETLGLGDIQPYTASDGFLLRCGKTEHQTADLFAQKIKTALGGAVKYVGTEKNINRVLVCSGSGGSYLYEAAAAGFDALVTADVKHNLFVDAQNLGIALFDGGHYETERIICAPLAILLREEFSTVCFEPFDPHIIKSI